MSTTGIPARTIVVAGAGLAGLRSAEQLRACGWSDRLIVVGDEPHAPYNRPPLSKEWLRGADAPVPLAFAQRPSTADVEWRLGTAITAADLLARRLILNDGSTLGYDGLVVATGVSARRLPIDAPLALRHTVRTVDDAAVFRQRLTPSARLLVIGAGFIGCEVAATAAVMGCEVSVVEPFGEPLERVIGSLAGAAVRRRHEAHGVQFNLGCSVTELRSTGQVNNVLLSDGTPLEVDVVIEAAGSSPNVSWLSGQGLDLTDGVLCDSDLHPLRDGQPVPEVVALGDVARFPLPLFDLVPRRVEHWTMPTELAGVAARRLLGGMGVDHAETTPRDVVPSFWSDQYGLRIQSFGLPALGTDDVRLLEGDLEAEAVLGYFLDDQMIGVVAFGAMRAAMRARSQMVDVRRLATLGS